MGYRLLNGAMDGIGEGRRAAGDWIDPGELARRIERLLEVDGPRYRRLWLYYENPMKLRGVDRDEQGSDRPYRQAQEWGLPSRVTGVRAGAEIFSGEAVGEVARKEVVIENDIGWRVDTMVDFLFGQSVVITARNGDDQRRGEIEAMVRAILEANGGTALLQQMALMGAVYGFVDVLVKYEPPPPGFGGPAAADGEREVGGGRGEGGARGMTLADAGTPAPSAAGEPRSASAAAEGSAPAADAGLDGSEGNPGASTKRSPDALIQRIARSVRLEVVEPARALPFLDPGDWRHVRGYAQVYWIRRHPGSTGPQRIGPFGRGFLQRLGDRAGRLFRSAPSNGRGGPGAGDDRLLVAEIITPGGWQRHEDERLVAEGGNSLGKVPLVHIQNFAVPLRYAGRSDVEPLIPIQDELNTRLSDRANRIALQSFKMYLGRCIDGFTTLPVAPGRMWATDNPDADVIEFGGESASPSEDRHIDELREAMDKISGVTPIAAGAIRGRIGNLTSAAALRVTMMALLAKTERKRTSYGEGIRRMCALALEWLDLAGLFRTTAEERQVEVHWASPIPDNAIEKLQEARAKRELGVPEEVVLREIGYARKDEG